MCALSKENAEVREELKKGRELTQELSKNVQKAREEAQKARREADEGRGEMKKWLASLGNEIHEGETRGRECLAKILGSITELFAKHNVSREDHKAIYREITMLETTIGSPVRGVVSEVVEKLRWELKSIFESLSEDSPRP